jgi:ferric-dicitrate binding protein FerR (iron transport regulator)
VHALLPSEPAPPQHPRQLPAHAALFLRALAHERAPSAHSAPFLQPLPQPERAAERVLLYLFSAAGLAAAGCWLLWPGAGKRVGAHGAWACGPPPLGAGAAM